MAGHEIESEAGHSSLLTWTLIIELGHARSRDRKRGWVQWPIDLDSLLLS